MTFFISKWNLSNGVIKRITKREIDKKWHKNKTVWHESPTWDLLLERLWGALHFMLYKNNSKRVDTVQTRAQCNCC